MDLILIKYVYYIIKKSTFAMQKIFQQQILFCHHELIENQSVIKAMESTIQLLNDGKQIPESILLPVIDFSKNFTDVCHHSKEEKS